MKDNNPAWIKDVENTVGDKEQRISVAYLGAALNTGQMDALLLADSLRGFAKLTKRVGHLLYGEDEDYVLQVRSEFTRGSFIAHLDIFTELVRIVDSKAFERTVAIVGLCGWSLKDIGQSLWTLFKKKRGRPITDEDDLSRILPANAPLTKLDIIRIFNDPEIRAAMISALRPLREEGYEEIQTRQNGIPVETMTRADLAAADAAEEDAVISEERKDLAIEKVAFREDLAWHFSDEGKTFDAQITDEKLWARVAKGERFAAGDRLTAVLRTVAQRDATGKLRQSRTIPEVVAVDHVGQVQGTLFPEEGQHPRN